MGITYWVGFWAGIVALAMMLTKAIIVIARRCGLYSTLVQIAWVLWYSCILFFPFQVIGLVVMILSNEGDELRSNHITED